MKKNENVKFIIVLFIFITLFIYNSHIKLSIIDSINLWLYTLVPSMLPMYLITDLLINYGLIKYSYKLFKSNKPILFFLSMLLGCPANVKYICDFYKNGYISKSEANSMLVYSYAPNPLFVIGIIPDFTYAIKTLLFLYGVNIVLSFLFRCDDFNGKTYVFKTENFTYVLEKSLYSSFNVLILILGIVMTYGVINTILSITLGINSLFIKSIIELTNAMHSMVNSNNYFLVPFACSFGGLSIHTQVKSILEDTSLDYKYFLKGRLITSFLALIFLFVFK